MFRSSDALWRLIDKRIEDKLDEINTADVGEITNINGSLVDVKIYNTGKKILSIPVFTLSGMDDMIQFPIKQGQNCLVIFTKHNNDGWYGSEQSEPNPSYDISNGYALIGVHNQSDERNVVDDPTISVEKLKIINKGGDDIISLMSDLLELVGKVIDENSSFASTTAGCATINHVINPIWTANMQKISPKYKKHKASLQDIKTKFDKFKV